MKKYLYIIWTILLVSSCSLDVEPETELTDLQFWKSETDLRGACNYLYRDLPGFSHDMRSEELVGPNQNSISSGNRTVPNTSSDWTDPYDKIGRCNNIVIKANASPLSETQKNRWIAEARFFRAYHYFDLVKKYGDVPLILKVFDSTDDPEIKKERDSRETVLQQCYADLQFAAEWLPNIDELADDANWGRVSRSAALGMVMRIGLYEGTYIKYHNLSEGDSRSHLLKAINAADTIINIEKKHELYPDFQTLFYFEGEGRQNKENVFVKVYGPDKTGIVHNNSRGLENAAAVSRQMLDNFLYADGLPREISPLRVVPEISYNDIIENRDPRLKMTIYSLKEEAYKGPYTPFKNDDQTHGYGYPIKKGFMADQWATNSKETVDKMIIRYAEVLLSYAEALYEYNGAITDEELDETVNLVRARAGFDVRLTNDFVQQHQLDMLQEIRRERMVEFIDENLHYDDIIRWKTAEVVLPKAMVGLLYNEDETTKKRDELGNRFTDENGYYNGVKVYDQANLYVIEEASSRSFDPERDYLYPIPTYEISTSNGNVKQNPKW